MSLIGLLSRSWHWANRRGMSLALNNETKSWGHIPITTRFFRNKPLMSEVFALIRMVQIPRTRLFFHACSSGEEPYSFVMHDLGVPVMEIDVVAADYVRQVLAIAQRAK